MDSPRMSSAISMFHANVLSMCPMREFIFLQRKTEGGGISFDYKSIMGYSGTQGIFSYGYTDHGFGHHAYSNWRAASAFSQRKHFFWILTFSHWHNFHPGHCITRPSSLFSNHRRYDEHKSLFRHFLYHLSALGSGSEFFLCVYARIGYFIVYFITQ